MRITKTIMIVGASASLITLGAVAYMSKSDDAQTAEVVAEINQQIEAKKQEFPGFEMSYESLDYTPSTSLVEIQGITAKAPYSEHAQDTLVPFTIENMSYTRSTGEISNLSDLPQRNELRLDRMAIDFSQFLTANNGTGQLTAEEYNSIKMFTNDSNELVLDIASLQEFSDDRTSLSNEMSVNVETIGGLTTSFDIHGLPSDGIELSGNLQAGNNNAAMLLSQVSIEDFNLSFSTRQLRDMAEPLLKANGQSIESALSQIKNSQLEINSILPDGYAKKVALDFFSAVEDALTTNKELHVDISIGSALNFGTFMLVSSTTDYDFIAESLKLKVTSKAK